MPGPESSQPLPAGQPAGQPATAIAVMGGEPSPGTACAGPGCWQRNTTRYGLRRLPLCPACRAALQGQDYKREPPPGAARGIAYRIGIGDLLVAPKPAAAIGQIDHSNSFPGPCRDYL
jgi:hypothetical protein